MYVTQVGHSPPRLAFFANVERDIPAHYLRFLATRFRAALGLVGTPLLLGFRRTGRTWAEARATGAVRPKEECRHREAIEERIEEGAEEKEVTNRAGARGLCAVERRAPYAFRGLRRLRYS